MYIYATILVVATFLLSWGLPFDHLDLETRQTFASFRDLRSLDGGGQCFIVLLTAVMAIIGCDELERVMSSFIISLMANLRVPAKKLQGFACS